MRRLLWIGDAGCDSGFARVTHYTLDALRESWDVVVLGLNYRGDPHDYPYPIFPAWPGGDLFGVGRLRELLPHLRPQLVVIQNDPWNVPAYVQAIEAVKDVPRPVLFGSIAVDGKNTRGWALNGLDHANFWTEFGRYEAIRGGFTRSSGVVPLGVDLNIYAPGDRLVARQALGLPELCWNGFIVGNVNRNQPRKRLDLTVRYFAEWVQERDVRDAFLFLHVAPTGDLGYDCEQLCQYYELYNQLILMQPAVYHGSTEEMLAQTYRAFDVQVSTSMGEGWGLTTMEGMACGIPQVVPNWSALGEWARDAAILVPADPVASLNKINVIGAVPHRKGVIDALDLLYNDPQARTTWRERGLTRTAEDRFRWENVARAFAREVDRVFTECDG